MDMKATPQNTSPRLLFSSDLHGNLDQYRRILKAADKNNCQAILLGGDLTPRRGALIKSILPPPTTLNSGEPQEVDPVLLESLMLSQAVLLQRQWFEKELVPVLRDETQAEVYMILGNSDFRANLEYFRAVLKRECGSRVVLLDDDCATIGCGGLEGPRKGEGYVVFGFPWVPPSPHSLKDGELMDLNCDCELIPKNRPSKTATSHLRSYPPRICGYSTTGLRSNPSTLHLDPTTLSLSPDQTIETRLAHLLNSEPLLSTTQPSRLIVMAHSPPLHTKCDLLKNREHVGSAALREFLSNHRPLISLHGHVHETVRMSGGFMDFLGGAGGEEEEEGDGKRRTVCIASGNDFKREGVMCVLIELDQLEKAVRFQA